MDENNPFDIARPKVTVEFVDAMKRRKEGIRHEAENIEYVIRDMIKMMPHYKPWNYPGGEVKLNIDIRNGNAMRVDLKSVGDVFVVPITPRTLTDVHTIRNKLNRVSHLRLMARQIQTKIARDQRTLKVRVSRRRI